MSIYEYSPVMIGIGEHYYTTNVNNPLTNVKIRVIQMVIASNSNMSATLPPLPFRSCWTTSKWETQCGA